MRHEQVVATVGRIIDLWMPWRMAYGRIPGLSIGIVSKGKLVYARGFGYADVASGTRATEKTGYRIASNSKTFTAVGIMQLVEANKLRLDDRVASYLPWFRPSGKPGSPITIRQLLSHSAGVFRDSTTPHWLDDDFPDRKELRRSAGVKADVIENSTRFKYSNFGFAVLGEIIRKVSGESYDDYMYRAIIEPLGMSRTAPDLTSESEDWLATGYSRPFPGIVERESFPHSRTKAYASATGFLSNVPDLARYIGALSLDSDAILGREAKKEMFRPQWETGEDGGAYAHGFEVTRVGRRRLLGHGGGFAGFITNQAFDPKDDLGVIVLTNCNDSNAVLIRSGIFATIDKLTSTADSLRSADTAGMLRPYEGTYRSRWSDVCVVRVASTLVAFPPNVDVPLHSATPLRRKGKNTFKLDGPFNFDSHGETARFTVSAGRATKLIWGSMPFVRLDEPS